MKQVAAVFCRRQMALSAALRSLVISQMRSPMSMAKQVSSSKMLPGEVETIQ